MRIQLLIITILLATQLQPATAAPEPFKLEAVQSGAPPAAAVEEQPQSALPPTAEPFRLNGMQNGTEEGPPPGKFLEGSAEKETAEQKLAWDRWHRQVRQAHFKFWKKVCRGDDRLNGLPDVNNMMRVVITADGQVFAILLRRSLSAAFDQDCVASYLQMAHTKILKFPKESSRQRVEWTQPSSYGGGVANGYGWIHGDVETIQH